MLGEAPDYGFVIYIGAPAALAAIAVIAAWIKLKNNKKDREEE